MMTKKEIRYSSVCATCYKNRKKNDAAWEKRSVMFPRKSHVEKRDANVLLY